MGELNEQDRQKLHTAFARRLGARRDATELVEAYLVAAQRHAFSRTVQAGPVPTSLTVERSGLLLEISQELGRVIDDVEIEALFRVSRSQARTMRTTLLASYSDITDDLTVDWALNDAHRNGRKTVGEVNGTVIRFSSEQKRDAFVSQMDRSGIDTEMVHDDEKAPWAVVVSDAFPRNRLPKSK
ncbi:hypothetical protein [Herbiconiux liangxiaofengii]|uniref:hypothetical protein n=1 Tax=Herbiconiux liangxiaofengii TaxID=3342795 RepID=UPI0035BA613B